MGRCDTRAPCDQERRRWWRPHRRRAMRECQVVSSGARAATTQIGVLWPALKGAALASAIAMCTVEPRKPVPKTPVPLQVSCTASAARSSSLANHRRLGQSARISSMILALSQIVPSAHGVAAGHRTTGSGSADRVRGSGAEPEARVCGDRATHAWVQAMLVFRPLPAGPCLAFLVTTGARAVPRVHRQDSANVALASALALGTAYRLAAQHI